MGGGGGVSTGGGGGSHGGGGVVNPFPAHITRSAVLRIELPSSAGLESITLVSG